MGVKTVTFYPGNADKGLHTHMAVHRVAQPLHRRAAGRHGWPPDHGNAHPQRSSAGFALAALARPESILITGKCAPQPVSAVALAALARPEKHPAWAFWAAGVQAKAAHPSAQAGLAGAHGISVSGSRTPAQRRNGWLSRPEPEAVAIEEAAAADVVLTAKPLSPGPVFFWKARWLGAPCAGAGRGKQPGPAFARNWDDEAMLSKLCGGRSPASSVEPRNREDVASSPRPRGADRDR